MLFRSVQSCTLINELTLYAKIDTNRIPYNFAPLSVNDYFNDCAEDIEMELDSKNVEFGYFNYVEGDQKIIADPEQLKRVINNIVSNSLKYMEREHGLINLRVKDVGDFIQVELEDNGKGIAAKDLPNIFDRFYRTDASRNSSKGGSGIGLSIVKKIIEDHGGKIWATSREGVGTVMYFVIRKYQEVPINRVAEVNRVTKETQISLALNLDSFFSEIMSSMAVTPSFFRYSITEGYARPA